MVVHKRVGAWVDGADINSPSTLQDSRRRQLGNEGHSCSRAGAHSMSGALQWRPCDVHSGSGES